MIFRKIKNICLVLIFTVVLYAPIKKVYASADAVLYIDPSSKSVESAHDFTLDVMVNPASTGQVDNVDLYLSYDQTKLSLVSISSTNFPVLVYSNIPSPEDGTAIYSASTDYGTHITTTSVYATLHFHTLALATDLPISIITGDGKSAVYSDSVPGTNLLGSVTPASVTITEQVDYSIGGTVSGLVGTLVLRNSGSGEQKSITTNGGYFFSTELITGSAYNVSVQTQPANQICTISNGSGTISNANVTNINVSCVDNIAPLRSSGSPSGQLASGTTSVTMSLSTNENATCKFSTSSNVTYASMVNTFETTGAKSHSILLTGLTSGVDYRYNVRCLDALNNVNADDYPITFSIASPPVVTPAVVANETSDDNSDDKKDSGSHKKKKEAPKKRTISSKKTIKRFSIMVQSGKRFSKKAPVLLYFSKPGGGFYSPTKVMTSSKGSFSLVYFVTKPAGTYTWYAVDTITAKKSKNQSYRIR